MASNAVLALCPMVVAQLQPEILMISQRHSRLFSIVLDHGGSFAIGGTNDISVAFKVNSI